jgi:hypothetical protein
LAGVPISSHCEGTDLSAAMRGLDVPSPGSVLLMHIQKEHADSEGGGRRAPLFRGVRTERYTYAVAEDGRWCLYDNREDPYQLRNLIDEPGRERTADELNELLSRWLERARDPFPLQSVRGFRSANR